MAQKSKSAESFYSYSAKRKLRKEEVAAYRRIALATVLIVGMLAVGYFVGVPLIAQMGGDDLGDASSTNKLGSRDTIPPTSPRIDSLPEATRDRSLTIKGTAESSSTVKIFINDQESLSLLVDREGYFQGDLELNVGLNTITATATDSAGNSSRLTQPITVLHKTTPPSLSLSQEVSQRTDKDSIIIKGKTEAGARVTVNGRSVILADDNSFESEVSLKSGSNDIRIVATDRAGNTRQISRTVIYENTPQSSGSAETKD